MHTKGVRLHGRRSSPRDWRRYMTYFLAVRNDLCLSALYDRGYQTCGVLKKNHIYAGNFWWTTAKWLWSRKDLFVKFPWEMKNRHVAEYFLLENVRDDDPNHYCVHHTHHDMMLCNTPPELYVNVNITFRKSSNCFYRNKTPKKPTKNNSRLWCHEDNLPLIE